MGPRRSLSYVSFFHQHSLSGGYIMSINFVMSLSRKECDIIEKLLYRYSLKLL